MSLTEPVIKTNEPEYHPSTTVTVSGLILSVYTMLWFSNCHQNVTISFYRNMDPDTAAPGD